MFINFSFLLIKMGTEGIEIGVMGSERVERSSNGDSRYYSGAVHFGRLKGSSR